MPCDANSLANEARCFVGCLSADENMRVQTYLLATIAGASINPNILAGLAACFPCMSTESLMALKTHLLCQLVSGGGGQSLPAGPTSEEWSLFLEEGLASLFASDNGSGFTHYCFRYRLNGGDWVDGVSTLIDETVGPFGVEGDVVEAQTRYCDAGGTPLSQWSGTKQVTNEDACADATAVTGLGGTASRGIAPDGYISQITWDQHPFWDTIVTKYTLLRSDTIGGLYEIVQDDIDPAIPVGSDDGAALGTLDPQTSYFYKVETSFNNGCSAALSEPFELDSGCQASAPLEVAQENEFLTEIVVIWNQGAVLPILDYRIQWGTSPGVYDGSDTVASNESTYTITDLLPSTDYFVLVTARDTLTCGAAAAETQLHTQDE